jgi:hypothetical protein
LGGWTKPKLRILVLVCAPIAMISSIIPVSLSFVGSKWTGLSAAKLPCWRGFKERMREGTEMRSKKYFKGGIGDSLFLTFWIADEPFGSP